MKLPMDDELYIVDFHPIYDRQKVHFITTYLCSKPYTVDENFWFDYQPCYDMDSSMIIYEWYYNIPAVQWPEVAGFRVGTNTPYQYIVIHIQYFQSIINNIYGEQITMTRTRPKYQIGIYQIATNSFDFQKKHADFSCQYHSSSIQIFSTQLYSIYEGLSISLYRVRNHELQSIIKGNLHWPQTFYQLKNSIDIKANDYLIGTCIYEQKSSKYLRYDRSDVICQITIMFWMEQEDEIPIEQCWNNDFSRIFNRYLPDNANIPPQTLFDINPTYPKLTPNQWVIMNKNISITISKSINNNTNIVFLTYSKINFRQEIIRLVRNYYSLLLISILILTAIIGSIILIIIIIRNPSCRHKKYFLRNKTQSKAIAVGGETSSLSEWLTKRRFQQYDQDNFDHVERQPLTDIRRWTTSSEESDLSDNEVFSSTNFQNIILKN
ncbi:unnamed protein product [Rotaria sordida]|nr:unnamed protein product [Rotaria sordida]CAF3757790.1 unnamed protein product [Rotaria sordida]